jgi:hypothetical protein
LLARLGQGRSLDASAGGGVRELHLSLVELLRKLLKACSQPLLLGNLCTHRLRTLKSPFGRGTLPQPTE